MSSGYYFLINTDGHADLRRYTVSSAEIRYCFILKINMCLTKCAKVKETVIAASVKKLIPDQEWKKRSELDK